MSIANEVHDVVHRAHLAERRTDEAVDPLSTQVIRHGLDAAAEQMMVALKRTAFSPIIYDGRDFAAAFYDTQIRLLAETQTLPVFSGSLGFCLQHTLDTIGGLDAVYEGDVYLLNYAYYTGSHQNDMVVILPTFHEGELLSFAVCKAHHMDLGGAWVFATHTTDIWQEGTVYTPLRLYERGRRNDEVLRILVANSRTPDILEGDLAAQIGSCRIGLEAMERVVARYGRDQFDAAVELMFDYGERLMRRVIAAIPNGKYEADGIADDDGISKESVPFHVSLEVRDEDVTADFTDAPPQTRGPINSSPPTVVACVRCALMSLIGDSETANEGYFGPIQVKTRPGTIFHALPPAPMGMFSWVSMHAVDHIHRALSAVIPAQIPAQGGSDGVNAINVWGTRADGTFWADATQHPGGQGAAPTYGDGGSPLLHITCSGTTVTSRELWEARTPFLVEMYELAPDSGGAGRFRGGPGVDTHHRVLRDLTVTVLWERTKSPPFGLAGGHAGRRSRIRIVYPDGSERQFTKASVQELPAGTLLILETGGGGGFGDPAERDPAAVRTDVSEGYISEDAARRDYPHAFS
jgi:N-methylhydantoinase B